MQKISVPFSFMAVYSILFFFCIFTYSCKSSTCSKTVPCPGYTPSAIDDWFPYHNNQQLLFKNSANQYDTLSLGEVDSTVAYDYTTGFDNQGGSCNATKMLVSTQKDSTNNALFSISLFNSQPSYSTVVTLGAQFTFSTNSFQGQNFTDGGFSNFLIYYGGQESPMFCNAVAQTLYNYSQNGITYPLVQSVTNDSAVYKNTPGVYKVIYAKNAGIIEYETNPGSIAWIKQ